MKKYSILKLISVLCVALLAISCAQKPAQSQEKKDNKVYEIKISHIASTGDAIDLGWKKFKEVIENKSDGRIKVTIFGNKQLSNSNREDAEKVQYNIVQMSSVPTYTLAFVANIREYQLCDFPYLFLNDAEIYKILDGPIGIELAEKLEQKIGIKALGSYSLGWVKIANTKRPITKPEDVKGLKIRTTEAELYIELIKAWGGAPTPMAFGEVYTALQQGTVDGMVTTTSLYITDRFYETLKYMTTVNPFSICHIPIVNMSWYNSLPDDLKQIFSESIFKEYLPYVRELEAKYEIEAIQWLRDKGGLEVLELTPEQLKPFIDASAHITKDKAHLIGEELMSRIKEELGR